MPNITLKNKDGNDVVYKGILSVTFNTEDGGKATFIYVSEEQTTTAEIENGVLVLNNAEINAENVLELDGAMIDEQGYLVIDKEV